MKTHTEVPDKETKKILNLLDDWQLFKDNYVCDDCLKKIKVINGKMRNETFKNMIRLEPLKYRRI